MRVSTLSYGDWPPSICGGMGNSHELITDPLAVRCSTTMILIIINIFCSICCCLLCICVIFTSWLSSPFSIFSNSRFMSLSICCCSFWTCSIFTLSFSSSPFISISLRYQKRSSSTHFFASGVSGSWRKFSIDFFHSSLLALLKWPAILSRASLISIQNFLKSASVTPKR